MAQFFGPTKITCHTHPLYAFLPTALPSDNTTLCWLAGVGLISFNALRVSISSGWQQHHILVFPSHQVPVYLEIGRLPSIFGQPYSFLFARVIDAMSEAHGSF